MLEQDARKAYLPLLASYGLTPKPPVTVHIREYQSSDYRDVSDMVKKGLMEHAGNVRLQGAMEEYIEKSAEHALKKAAASPRVRFNRRLWVAEFEGQVVGCIGIKPTGIGSRSDKDCVLLYQLSVHQAYRRRHIGTQLMDAVHAHCVKEEIKNICLSVPAIAKSANAFFKHCRFKQTGQAKAYNLDWAEFSAQVIKPELEPSKKKKRRRRRAAKSGRH